jgi:hypothetical protein
MKAGHGAALYEKTPDPLKISNGFPLRFEKLTLVDNRPSKKSAARERVERRAGQVVQSRNIRTPIAKSLTRAIDEYCIPKDNINIWSPGKVIARTR